MEEKDVDPAIISARRADGGGRQLRLLLSALRTVRLLLCALLPVVCQSAVPDFLMLIRLLLPLV